MIFGINTSYGPELSLYQISSKLGQKIKREKVTDRHLKLLSHLK